MKHPISEYFNRTVVFPPTALNAEGTRLAYISSMTGSPQIWVGQIHPNVDLLVYPKPITFSTVKQPYVMQAGTIQWIGSDALVYVMNTHGDEQTFIEVQDFKTGEISEIPKPEGARDLLSFIGSDQKTIFFTSNRDNPNSHGLFTFSLKSKKVQRVFQDKDWNAAWSSNISYNGHFIFQKYPTNSSNTLHAVHLKSKKVIDLYTKSGSQIEVVGALPDGKLMVLTNHGRQFNSLAIFDPKQESFDFIASEKWDVDSAELSPDRKLLWVNRNVAGTSQLELYKWPKLKRSPLKIPGHGVKENIKFSMNGKFGVFSFSSPTESRNLYRLNVKKGSTQKLTDTWTSRIPKKDLCDSKSVQYESQNHSVQSWLYLPKKTRRNKKVPVIIWPHGGPQWQERAQFRPIFQYFAGNGFAIWAPNPQGSTGFGKDFARKICGQWGTADLPDMLNGIEWLKKSGWIDPNRIAIMGGSYGGYMTLRSMTRIPKTFKAGVDIFGVSNLLSFVTSVPEEWRPYMEEMVGNKDRDFEKLKEQSPIFEIEKIDCPLLIIQGAKDPRVVKAESDQAVTELKKLKKEVEYVVYEDEGHGFLKLENELDAYTKAACFLEKWL